VQRQHSSSREAETQNQTMENVSMSHLTVTEKEHWKQRISRRIDKAIDAIYAAQPDLKTRIAEAARSEALRSLGLAQLQQQIDTIEENEKRTSRQKEATYKQMFAVVAGKNVDELPYYSHYTLRPNEVTTAIERRQTVHEEELLARDPQGKRILTLRREKEELLDTVWLATSGQQIKELWQSVAELLSDEPTELQTQAIRIEPVESN
jgi:hypothetical protein